MSKPLRKAATMIVCAPTTTGFKILMVKRGSTAKFMPNAYVFPGGVQDPEDPTSRHTALRELYEETGILLQHHNNYQILDGSKTAYLNAIGGSWQQSPTASVLPYSRWITPEQEKMRFDTMFYLCALPTTKTNHHQPPDVIMQVSEISDTVWVTPQEALERHSVPEKAFRLPPPQWFTMNELSKYRTVDEVLAMYQGKDEDTVPTKQPVLQKGKSKDGADVMNVIFPGDAEHFSKS
eukprot:PhF_6_TR438/c0_g1_i1/m.161